jgi:transcriptional regulator with XRE-family HTH domain
MSEHGKEFQRVVTVQIKAEMGAKGWKQADLAVATGLPTSTLSRYMGGLRDIPFPVFAELAHALDLTIVELIERAQRRAAGDQT